MGRQPDNALRCAPDKPCRGSRKAARKRFSIHKPILPNRRAKPETRVTAAGIVRRATTSRLPKTTARYRRTSSCSGLLHFALRCHGDDKPPRDFSIPRNLSSCSRQPVPGRSARGSASLPTVSGNRAAAMRERQRRCCRVVPASAGRRSQKVGPRSRKRLRN